MLRRAAVLGLCFALFSIQPTLGGAAVITQSFAASSFDFDPGLVSLYDYTSGSPATWTDPGDFDAGTYSATEGSSIPGAVLLDRIGPSGVAEPDGSINWWDTDWTNRRCFSIDHTAVGANTVAEYQLRLPFPVDQLTGEGFLQSDLGDLRAIAADGVTSLPLWPDDTEPDTIWVQVDEIIAGASGSVCLYYGYSLGTATSPANHTEAAVFTYSSPQPVYYTVADAYSAGTTPINVVTYIDGNEVSRDGGPAVTLTSAGDLTTFDAAGNSPGSVLSVVGPISSAGIGDGVGPLVPISFAGTSFAAPINRDGQAFSFVAPFGDAAVTLSDGGTVVATFTVTAGTPYTHTADDISAGSAALIESDLPVLVTHRSDVGGDFMPVYPATAGSFYAVRSTSALVGYGTDATSVAVAGSDGAASTITGDRGDISTLGGGAGQGGGPADGLWLTSTEPVGVISQDDGDGNESVTVVPVAELGAEYWIPADSQYIAFACPTAASADVSITVSPPGGPDRPVICSGGPDVAWAADAADLSVTATGTRIASDDGAVFSSYFETLANDDELSLLGMKQGRQYTWPEPVVTAGGDEGILESSGTWESATVDTEAGTAVFGNLRIIGDVPAGTTLRLQVATAAAGTPIGFVGPDGTDGTHFTIATLPSVLDFAHDGDQLLRVRAELATSNPATASPRLDSVAVDAHLALLNRSLGSLPTLAVATTADPTVTTTHLLRVKTSNATITGSEATAVYRVGSNLGNLVEETVRFVNEGLGINSVQQSITQPVDSPLVFQNDRPHSVVLDHSAVGTGVTTLRFSWQLDYAGEGSIFSETDFAVTVTAP